MNFPGRVRPAFLASSKHLLASVVAALAVAALVFGVWYPHPYAELASGRALFVLLVSVDVVCGPLLTLVIYNPRKPKKELWRDIGLVVVLQLAALCYGLASVAQARPVYLAFEGDRFRVVSVPDINLADLNQATSNLRHLSFTGPRLLGVRLARGTDADLRQSIELALQGLHPAFRPSRWVDYELQRPQVVAQARPLADLRRKYPAQAPLIAEAVQGSGLASETLGFLPLLAENRSDWVVVVGLQDGLPKAYLPLDGFF